jgi:hypothetical protein
MVRKQATTNRERIPVSLLNSEKAQLLIAKVSHLTQKLTWGSIWRIAEPVKPNFFRISSSPPIRFRLGMGEPGGLNWDVDEEAEVGRF